MRGRLIEINRTPVQKFVSKDSQGDNATHRELSLTWTDELPEDNKILAGSWWEPTQSPSVSVEKKLADSLKIKLGDQLTFSIDNQLVSVAVSSLRELRWDTMKPNFYMIFSPGVLNQFPSTFITSFYLPESQKDFLNTLVKKYPGITVLEVDLILKQFKTLLMQLTQAVNYLLYFALMAGFTVLFAAVYATLDNRIYEGAILRTFGANKSFLRKTQWIEFGLLGLISGILAVLISQSIVYALYRYVMVIEYQFSFSMGLMIPLIGSVFVSLVGFLGVKRVLNHPPLRVLREL